MKTTGVLSALGRVRDWCEKRRAIARGEAHPLTMAKPGGTYRIWGVAGRDKFTVCSCFQRGSGLDHATCVRLLEMGLVPGVQVSVLGNGDPLILGLWGGRTALSRSLAREIFVVDPVRRAAAAVLGGESDEEERAA